MPARPAEELLVAAALRVSWTRAVLARPRACHLDECVTWLREAQGYLEWLRDSLPGMPRDTRPLRKDAAALAAQIRHTDILLEQAARFGRHWIECLRSSAAYKADGTFPPLAPCGRISFFG